MSQTMSFDDALIERRVPAPTEELLRRVASHIPLGECTLRPDVIQVSRTDGEPPLDVQAGQTVGFTSIEEVRAACGEGVKAFASGVRLHPRTRLPLWGVEHPAAPVRAKAPKAKAQPREKKLKPQGDQVDYGYCMTCFMKKTVTGACSC